MPQSPTNPRGARERRLGYAFALAAITIFSLQDGISKHLGSAYPPVFVTMIRYWAFAGFALLLAARARGGIPASAKSGAQWVQVARGTLLALQIAVAITCFAVIGLVRTQAIFAATPLIATVMSVMFLGERAHALRWFAVMMGFGGVLLILRPTGDFFDPRVLLAVLCAFMFATYVVLTRLAGRVDPPVTSFFYTGVVGCAVISLIGNLIATHARRHPELLQDGALERGWLAETGLVPYRGALFAAGFAFIGVMTIFFPSWSSWLALGLIPLGRIISRSSDRRPSATRRTGCAPSS